MSDKTRAAWTRAIAPALAMPPKWAPTQGLARPKYGAQKVELDGLRFDSKKEAARYVELKVLLKCDLIRELVVHPGWPIIVHALYKDGPPWEFTTVGMFHADFKYTDLETGEVIIEDVKSPPTRTTAYRLRKKLVEAIHGISIRELA